MADTFAVLGTPEGIQKYIMGTKKNGDPRAIYDIFTDFVPPRKKKSKKKKKNKGKQPKSMYDFYVDSKKKSKKKKKKKYWHI